MNAAREEPSRSLLGRETNDQPPAETHPPYLIIAAGLDNKAAAAFSTGTTREFAARMQLGPSPLSVFTVSYRTKCRNDAPET